MRKTGLSNLQCTLQKYPIHKISADDDLLLHYGIIFKESTNTVCKCNALCNPIYLTDQDNYPWKLLHIQSFQKYFLSPSRNFSMFTSSPFSLHVVAYPLVCRNSVELNFVKTRLKCKFGVNPQFFSHELCLYITRFYLNERGGFYGARIGKTITAFIDQGDWVPYILAS